MDDNQEQIILEKYYWQDLGRGHTTITPTAEMLALNGHQITRMARLKGDPAGSDRPIICVYNRYFVVHRITTLLRNLLSIPKEDWIELCDEIWEEFQIEEEPEEKTKIKQYVDL